MQLLQQMASVNRLSAFIDELVAMKNEETEEKQLWELWLHRVFDQSFGDFVSRYGKSGGNSKEENESQENIVSHSFAMLNGFSV